MIRRKNIHGEDTHGEGEDTIGCPLCDSFPGKGQAKPRGESAVGRVSQWAVGSSGKSVTEAGDELGVPPVQHIWGRNSQFLETRWTCDEMLQ